MYRFYSEGVFHTASVVGAKVVNVRGPFRSINGVLCPDQYTVLVNSSASLLPYFRTILSWLGSVTVLSQRHFPVSSGRASGDVITTGAHCHLFSLVLNRTVMVRQDKRVFFHVGAIASPIGRGIYQRVSRSTPLVLTAVHRILCHQRIGNVHLLAILLTVVQSKGDQAVSGSVEASVIRRNLRHQVIISIRPSKDVIPSQASVQVGKATRCFTNPILQGIVRSSSPSGPVDACGRCLFRRGV